MGARLIGEVLVFFNDLPSDAFKLLTKMAHMALDEESKGHPPRLYFGGRDLLALTLNRELAHCEPGSKEWRGTYANVRRGLQVCIEAGAVERVNVAHTGERQVYKLTLERNPDYKPTKRGGRRVKREASQSDSPEACQSDSPVGKRGESVTTQEASQSDSPKEPVRNQQDLDERFHEPRVDTGWFRRTGPTREAETDTDSQVVKVPDPETAAAAHDVLMRDLQRAVPYVLQAEDEIGPGHPRCVYEVRAVELIGGHS